MNKTLVTYPEWEMPKTIPYTGVKIPETDADMNYLEKKNINEDTR